MSKLPYPPPPELGWYANDGVGMTEDASTVEPADYDIADNAIYKPEYQLEYTPQLGAEGGEEWDGTVLSSSFISHEPKPQYHLYNETTKQDIDLDRSVLLGRKPSQNIPDGAKAVTILDPTRTVSRNHAAISFDADGEMWIEEFGSLNGTMITRDGEDVVVKKGTPVKLEAPATVRIGDQIFTLEEQSKAE